MQRDDDLIRRIMLEIEADPEPFPVIGAGTVRVRITNAGHDFLAVLANETIWTKARAKAAEAVPRYGLKLLAEIGNELIRQALRDKGLLP